MTFKLRLINFWKKSKSSKKHYSFDNVVKRKNYWPLSRIAGTFVIWYGLAILIGTIILASPFALTEIGKGAHSSHNFKWDFLSSLFTSSSAFSDTGFSVANTALVYNFAGQLTILILIQIGGFGVLTFKVMLFVFIGKKISLKDKILVQGERGSSSLGGTIELIKVGFLFLMFIEIISAVALFIPFYFQQVPAKYIDKVSFSTYHNWLASVWSSLFHSVSSINNAGFDIIGQDSLQPYNEIYFVQFIFVIEFVIGGIGFPTFYDLYNKAKAKINKKYSSLSLF